ncbi:MAG: hypothetical protein ABI670_07960 [Chloroflexota bacterium]
MSQLADKRSKTESVSMGIPGLRSQVSPIRLSWLLSAQWSLALLAFLCCLAVLFANLRHTGSLSFPVDDGYIYSNYVLSASQGHFFTYNAGEVSGGITGIGWYFLCTVAYWLLAPLHDLLGNLATAEVRVDVETARQAGHLYLAAYIPGIICLALTGIGVYRLALLALPPLNKNGVARNIFCWLLGAAAIANLGLVWGAMSGLEAALSTALSVWAFVFLLREAREGTLRWSLLLVALLPLARPDLLAMSGAAFLWLLWRAFRGPYPSANRVCSFRNVALFLGAVVVGVAVMCGIYYVGWGRPLASSFYAKVGGLRLGDKFWFAARDLVTSRGVWPIVGGALAALGGIVQWLLPSRSKEKAGVQEAADMRETSSAALLLLLVPTVYVVAMMLTLPWFGQEERYILPVYPFATILLGLLVWRLLQYVPLDLLRISVAVRIAGATAVALVLIALVYVWATRLYVVEVRNIRDAHVLPAVWASGNTPPDSIIAAEPIGAIKLFSHRRTFDIVGLTSPAALGTFRDWPRSWEVMRANGAGYLFYYPDWFDGGPPAWAVEVQRFAIPDNRIAGSSIIALYRLDWGRYVPLSP